MLPKNARVWSALWAVSVFVGGCGASPEDGTENEPEVATTQAELSAWVPMPGQARDIAVGSASDTAWSTAWKIGNNSYNGGYQVYRWYARTWEWVAYNGGGVRIAVEAFSGRPWVVNRHGEIWHLPDDTNPNGTWIRYPGCASDIGAGDHAGQVWFLGCVASGSNYPILKVNGMNTPILSNGGAVRIAVAVGGIPWVVSAVGTVYKRNSPYPEPSRGTWVAKSYSGRAYDIAANTQNYGIEAWIIGRVPRSGGHRIEYLRNTGGNNWVLLPSGSGVTIASYYGTVMHTNNQFQSYVASQP